MTPTFKIYRLLALLLLCIPFGCAREQNNVQRGIRDQELYVGIGTEPAALDPHLTTGLVEFNVMIALFEGLTTLDACLLYTSDAADD